jgi:hypothetical protein
MKFILALFIFPLISWSVAPDCDRIKRIIEELEKRTASSFIGGQCSTIKIDEELAPYLEAEKKDKTLLKNQKQLIEQYKCKNLSAIDLKLKSIESELTLLQGIEALKEDIKTKASEVKTLPKKEQVQEAAKEFVKSLKIASTFEKILKTEKNKDSFLEALGEQKADDWKDIPSFMSYRNLFCKEVKEKKDTICADNFSIDQASFNELRDAVALMKPNKRFESGKVKSLKKAMEIKKSDDSNYSFSDMMNSINLPEDGRISPSVLNAIKNVPDFKNDEKYSFLIKLRESKSQITARSFIDRFNILARELQARQQFEIMSKLSVILHQHSDIISKNNLTDQCTLPMDLNVDFNKTSVTQCLNSIKDKSSVNSHKAELDDLIEGFSGNIDYLQALKKKAIACNVDELMDVTGSMNLPESCLTVSQDKAKLMEELISLRALRNYVLKEQTELLTMRNLALSKIPQNCLERRDSIIGECHSGVTPNLSREVSILSDSAMNVMAILDKSDPNTQYAQFCNGQSNRHYNSELCELLVKDPSISSSDYSSPPVSAGGSRPTLGNVIREMTGAISNGIQQEMFRRQLMSGPPQPYFPAPTQFSARPMSINQKAFGSVPSIGLYIPVQ